MNKGLSHPIIALWMIGWFTSMLSASFPSPIQGVDPTKRDPSSFHYAPGTLDQIKYDQAREQKKKELNQEDPLFQNFYQREFQKKEKKK